MRIVVVVLGCVAMSGCASVPSLEFRRPGSEASTRLISHALCEISSAKTFEDMQRANYTLAIAMTIKAEDNVGATPSLNFLAPSLANASFSRQLLVGGELSKKRERTLTENVEIKLGRLTKEAACKVVEGRGYGEFGISEVLERRAFLPELTPLKDEPPQSERARYYAVLNEPVTSFGSQVQFTVKWGLAGGPYFVRRRFKGPSDKGFLNTSRSDVSTLLVAFAKPKTTAATKVIIVEDQTRIQARARMLFEQLITPAERDALSAKGFVEEASRDRIRRDVMARATRQAEADAAAENARANAVANAAAEEEAARDARGLINQMILQNLTVKP